MHKRSYFIKWLPHIIALFVLFELVGLFRVVALISQNTFLLLHLTHEYVELFLLKRIAILHFQLGWNIQIDHSEITVDLQRFFDMEPKFNPFDECLDSIPYTIQPSYNGCTLGAWLEFFGPPYWLTSSTSSLLIYDYGRVFVTGFTLSIEMNCKWW